MKKFFQLVTSPLWIPLWFILSFVIWMTEKKTYGECLDIVAKDVLN